MSNIGMFLLGAFLAVLGMIALDRTVERLNPCLDRLQTTSWTIPMEGNCEVYMPHGRKRCALPLLRGGEIVKEGY